MSRVRLTAIGLLALALVVAGCGAPMAQPDSSLADGEDSAEADITIKNGSLTIDPDAAFARLQTVTGTDIDPPNELRVFNDPSEFRNQSGRDDTVTENRFATVAGMRTTEVTEPLNVTRQKNGFVTALGSVILFVGENASILEERLLVVHELTHYVQVKNRRQRQLLSSGLDPTTTDGKFVVRALMEGGAIVTTDAYLDRYGNASDANSEMYTRVQSKLPDGHIRKYGNAKYVFGDAYMESFVEDPGELPAVYENPPRTSEQVIHGVAPHEEPPAPLSVALDTGAKWRAAGNNRMGEAFARFAMEQWVGSDRAARAAAGWGNDTVRYLRPTNGSGETAYVWTLRWDDAANATEFASAYRDALDARGSRDGCVWSLSPEDVAATVQTPTDRTTVISFGPKTLVDSLTATGENGDISVSTASG